MVDKADQTDRPGKTGKAAAAGRPEQELTFEQALEKLENIVQQLESGDVPLEKGIELFQEGMELARICSGKLEQIERKIEMLVEENGEMVRKPFQAE